MSVIELQHRHTLSAEQARQAIQNMANALSTRFKLACQWQGECLAFSRSGVDGNIALAPGQVQVKARLGFPVSLMHEQIEAEIRRVLREKLTCQEQ